MYSWCRVVIFVVSISIKIGSTYAICAAGQRTLVSTICTESYLIGQGEYAAYRCSKYVSDWSEHCVDDGNCGVCLCSCLPSNTGCPAQAIPYETNEDCIPCGPDERGDGLTCTKCPVNSISTNPVSGVCACAVTRSLVCSGDCECTPYSGSDNAIHVISDGPSDYAGFSNCVYTMDSSYIMTLQFTMFATELFYDQVFIDKCTTQACTTASELFFGHGSTNLQAVYQSDATYPVLRLRFTSDERTTGPGWAANWGLSTAIESTCRRVPTCVSGQYLNSNDACESCLANSNSPAGSTAITGCICNAGYTGADGGICLQCLGGTYKAGVGSAICTSCQANSFSPAGSIINTACRCNGGYTGANGSTCWQCLPGKFKSVY